MSRDLAGIRMKITEQSRPPACESAPDFDA
jgi:hypothetical protein